MNTDTKRQEQGGAGRGGAGQGRAQLQAALARVSQLDSASGAHL